MAVGPRPAPGRLRSVHRLAAAALTAFAVAGCGGSSPGSNQAGTPSAGATTGSAAASTPSAYQSAAAGVLRPMLGAIATATHNPHSGAAWHGLEQRARQAYVRIGNLRPPARVADLNRLLVQDLQSVISASDTLARTLGTGDLAGAQPAALALSQAGQKITNVGNQFKARGYGQVGAVLAGP